MKFLILILILVNLSCATLSRDRLYYDALEEIKTGHLDFAFMKLNDYLREYPNSIHTREIKFALIEYYFQSQNYRDCLDELTRYIIDYSLEENRVFAQAILYKALLDYKSEPLLAEKLRQSFFSKSIFLIFSESKTKSYKSILNNRYKIIDYVDKVEVLKNNELFFKISP